MKMRAREMVLASLLIVVALFSGMITTTAGRQSVSYRGTLDTWYSDPDAKIVESYWGVHIDDGKAVFFMVLIELDIAEEVPGTYDYFMAWMITGNVVPTGDGYVISGTTHWWKNWVSSFTFETVITISETDYWTQFRMDLDGHWMTGSLLP